MHHAHVRFRLPEGGVVQLGHGDLIGRLFSAALPLLDPRVSEGHAMVSLRGGELWLLSLRRRVAVNGRTVGDVRLEPGLVVEFAEGLALTVVSVEVPEEVLGIAVGPLPAMALPAVCSIRTQPEVSVSSRFEPEARCRVWTDGERWWRQDGVVTVAVAPGDQWSVDGVPVVAVAVPLSGSGQNATRLTGGLAPPLRLITSWDTAHLHVGALEPVVFAGLQARLLSELVQLGGPASWEVVARVLWPDEPELGSLRKRWDVTLGRLRLRLKEARVRHDFVRSVGTGQVELVLRAGDTVEDRS